MHIVDLSSGVINQKRIGGGEKSVLYNNKHGQLLLSSGKGNDRLEVKKTGDNKYTVTVNGRESFVFNKDQMARLTLSGGKGADSIQIDHSVDVPLKFGDKFAHIPAPPPPPAPDPKTLLKIGVHVNGALSAEVEIGAGDAKARLEKPGRSSIGGILSDPTLSIEDKVLLVLQLVMNKMDEDIEDQMKKIEELQSKSSGGGVLGSIAGAFGGGSSDKESIDVESAKLSRLISKRGQMFEIFQSIIDQYEKTAQSSIQSMKQG